MVILDKQNQIVEQFWTSIGMKVTIMAAEKHDEIYALGECQKPDSLKKL